MAKRWIEQLGSLLSGAYTPSLAAAVYYPTMPGVTYTSPAQVWTATSCTADVATGLGRRAYDLTGSSSTLAITLTCDSFDLLYTQASTAGSFEYQIDGGTFTSVNAAVSPTLAGRKVTVTGLTATSHTINVAWVSGTTAIEGLIGYQGNRTSGVHIWDGGHCGYNTSHFVDAANPHWIDVVNVVQPQLVLVMLGVNDYSGDTIPSPAVFTNLQALVRNVRAQCTNAPSIVIIGSYQAYVPTIVEAWAQYIAVLNQLIAADAELSFVFLVPPFGGYGVPQTGDALLDADLVHPNDTGYALLAQTVYGHLLGAW